MSKVWRDDNLGKQLTELRRSHASGVHDSRPPRTSSNRKAIEMSILDGEYPESRYLADVNEPTEEELEEIAAEDFYRIDDEDYDSYDDYSSYDSYDNEYDIP